MLIVEILHSRLDRNGNSYHAICAATKGEPHAGCTPEDIAAWIVANVGPVEGAKL